MFIYDEYQTLQRMMHRSIARYGDGELKLALGKDCVSQIAHPKLADELKMILIDYETECLVGIPRIIPEVMPPKSREFWQKIAANPKYNALYTNGIKYGSSFVTRPDNAPHIDTDEYWRMVPYLWDSKDITFVAGSDRSLVLDDFKSAKSVESIVGPRRDAYEYIDQIEKRIVDAKNHTVILALGATATCLAHRLSNRGFHAIDLGHIGMFMRHKGKYYASLSN